MVSQFIKRKIFKVIEEHFEVTSQDQVELSFRSGQCVLKDLRLKKFPVLKKTKLLITSSIVRRVIVKFKLSTLFYEPIRVVLEDLEIEALSRISLEDIEEFRTLILEDVQSSMQSILQSAQAVAPKKGFFQRFQSMFVGIICNTTFEITNIRLVVDQHVMRIRRAVMDNNYKECFDYRYKAITITGLESDILEVPEELTLDIKYQLKLFGEPNVYLYIDWGTVKVGVSQGFTLFLKELASNQACTSKVLQSMKEEAREANLFSKEASDVSDGVSDMSLASGTADKYEVTPQQLQELEKVRDGKYTLFISIDIERLVLVLDGMVELELDGVQAKVSGYGDCLFLLNVEDVKASCGGRSLVSTQKGFRLEVQYTNLLVIEAEGFTITLNRGNVASLIESVNCVRSILNELPKKQAVASKPGGGVNFIVRDFYLSVGDTSLLFDHVQNRPTFSLQIYDQSLSLFKTPISVSKEGHVLELKPVECNLDMLCLALSEFRGLPPLISGGGPSDEGSGKWSLECSKLAVSNSLVRLMFVGLVVNEVGLSFNSFSLNDILTVPRFNSSFNKGSLVIEPVSMNFNPRLITRDIFICLKGLKDLFKGPEKKKEMHLMRTSLPFQPKKLVLNIVHLGELTLSYTDNLGLQAVLGNVCELAVGEIEFGDILKFRDLKGTASLELEGLFRCIMDALVNYDILPLYDNPRNFTFFTTFENIQLDIATSSRAYPVLRARLDSLNVSMLESSIEIQCGGSLTAEDSINQVTFEFKCLKQGTGTKMWVSVGGKLDNEFYMITVPTLLSVIDIIFVFLNSIFVEKFTKSQIDIEVVVDCRLYNHFTKSRLCSLKSKNVNVRILNNCLYKVDDNLLVQGLADAVGGEHTVYFKKVLIDIGAPELATVNNVYTLNSIRLELEMNYLGKTLSSRFGELALYKEDTVEFILLFKLFVLANLRAEGLMQAGGYFFVKLNISKLLYVDGSESIKIRELLFDSGRTSISLEIESVCMALVLAPHCSEPHVLEVRLGNSDVEFSTLLRYKPMIMYLKHANNIAGTQLPAGPPKLFSILASELRIYKDDYCLLIEGLEINNYRDLDTKKTDATGSPILIERRAVMGPKGLQPAEQFINGIFRFTVLKNSVELVPSSNPAFDFREGMLRVNCVGEVRTFIFSRVFKGVKSMRVINEIDESLELYYMGRRHLVEKRTEQVIEYVFAFENTFELRYSNETFNFAIKETLTTLDCTRTNTYLIIQERETEFVVRIVYNVVIVNRCAIDVSFLIRESISDQGYTETIAIAVDESRSVGCSKSGFMFNVLPENCKCPEGDKKFSSDAKHSSGVPQAETHQFMSITKDRGERYIVICEVKRVLVERFSITYIVLCDQVEFRNLSTTRVDLVCAIEMPNMSTGLTHKIELSPGDTSVYRHFSLENTKTRLQDKKLSLSAHGERIACGGRELGYTTRAKRFTDMLGAKHNLRQRIVVFYDPCLLRNDTSYNLSISGHKGQLLASIAPGECSPCDLFSKVEVDVVFADRSGSFSGSMEIDPSARGVLTILDRQGKAVKKVSCETEEGQIKLLEHIASKVEVDQDPCYLSLIVSGTDVGFSKEIRFGHAYEVVNCTAHTLNIVASLALYNIPPNGRAYINPGIYMGFFVKQVDKFVFVHLQSEINIYRLPDLGIHVKVGSIANDKQHTVRIIEVKKLPYMIYNRTLIDVAFNQHFRRIPSERFTTKHVLKTGFLEFALDHYFLGGDYFTFTVNGKSLKFKMGKAIFLNGVYIFSDQRIIFIDYRIQDYNNSGGGLVNNEAKFYVRSLVLSFVGNQLTELACINIRNLKCHIQLRENDIEAEITVSSVQIDNQASQCVTPYILLPRNRSLNIQNHANKDHFIKLHMKYYFKARVVDSLNLNIRGISVIAEEEIIVRLFGSFTRARTASTPLDITIHNFCISEQNVNFTIIPAEQSKFPGFQSEFILFIIKNLSDMNFSINSFRQEYFYGSPEEMVYTATAFYKKQLRNNFLSLLGSIDIIGNWGGFGHEIGSGISGFIDEQSKAMQGEDVLDVFRGVTKGVLGLVTTAVGSVAGSVTKITGSISKNFGRKEALRKYCFAYIADESLGVYRYIPSNDYRDLQHGTENLMKGFKSFQNLVKNPVEGAKKKGITGFFRGVGKGVTSVIRNQVVGWSDFASGVADSIKVTMSPIKVCRMSYPYYSSDVLGFDIDLTLCRYLHGRIRNSQRLGDFVDGYRVKQGFVLVGTRKTVYISNTSIESTYTKLILVSADSLHVFEFNIKGVSETLKTFYKRKAFD